MTACGSVQVAPGPRRAACHAYLHGGSRGDFCYHTGPAAATCPSSARPVLASEVGGLIAGRESNNGERTNIYAPSGHAERFTTIARREGPLAQTRERLGPS